MSAIQPMDVTMSRPAMPAPASAAPASAEPAHPFAEVMRSAVTAAPVQHSTAKPQSATISAHYSSHRPASTSKAPTDAQTDRAQTASRQTPNGDAATSVQNQDDQNAAASPALANPSNVADAGDVSRMEAKTSSAVLVGVTGNRSGQVDAQQVTPDDPQTRSSTSRTGRKQTSSSKDTDASSRVSAPSTTAAMLVMATVPVSVTNLPAATLPEATANGLTSATKSTPGSKPINARATNADSSPLSSAASSGPAAGVLQMDGSTAATRQVPNAADMSTEGIAALQRAALAHGAQAVDEKHAATSNPASAANSTATSAANQNGTPVESSGGNQPTSSPDGAGTHLAINGTSNSAANSDVSNSITAVGQSNSSSGGIDSIRSGGDRPATSTHGDALKNNSFSAAVPIEAAAKDSAGSHANLPVSGLGLHDAAGLVSAAGHSGASGSFSSSATGSTVAHATISDTFAAIDSGAVGERGVLLHAAPHQVAVGVSDPALGWVEVRAERVSGQIAAALTTSSSASHAALTSVLPTMATYLQDHQAGVHQVHVETSLAGGQAGAGSQGQAFSQSDGRAVPDNRLVSNAATNSWNSVPVGSTPVATGQRINSMHEGHHFSIRA